MKRMTLLSTFVAVLLVFPAVGAWANEPPVAIATYDVTTGDAPLTVCIDARQSYDPDGDPIVLMWWPDAGSIVSFGRSCAYYSRVGSYQATLFVQTADGQVGTNVQTITVKRPAVPPVTEAVIRSRTGLAYCFDGSRSHDYGGPLTYTWNFGDGTPVSNEVAPCHTYQSANTYTADLTVVNELGLSSSASLTFKAEEGNSPPVADAGPDRNVYTGVLMPLNGSGTDPNGDPIIGWSWLVERAPAPNSWDLRNADKANAVFVGYVSGDYLVGLAVTDGIDINVDYATISVRDNLPPVAVATADRTTITRGEQVCFDGSQSYDPEGRPLTYRWDFDDGSPLLYEISPCHIFAFAGVKQVSLLVVAEPGSSDSDILHIEVLPPANRPPVASPTANPTTGTAPLEVQFAANASDPDGNPLTFLWEFGDGTTSNIADPLHTFTTAGTYSVVFTVSDGVLSNTYPITVVVDPRFIFKVTSASVRWNKKLLGEVTFSAFLDALVPGPTDVVSVTFDGIPLVAVPFSAFKQMLNGSYRYSDAGLLVQIDPVAMAFVVSTSSKTNLSTFDESNGVSVELALGSHTAVETITMTPDRNNRLIYSAPAP